jgi:hypothetical protein
MGKSKKNTLDRMSDIEKIKQELNKELKKLQIQREKDIGSLVNSQKLSSYSDAELKKILNIGKIGYDLELHKYNSLEIQEIIKNGIEITNNIEV